MESSYVIPGNEDMDTEHQQNARRAEWQKAEREHAAGQRQGMGQTPEITEDDKRSAAQYREDVWDHATKTFQAPGRVYQTWNDNESGPELCPTESSVDLSAPAETPLSISGSQNLRFHPVITEAARRLVKHTPHSPASTVQNSPRVPPVMEDALPTSTSLASTVNPGLADHNVPGYLTHFRRPLRDGEAEFMADTQPPSPQESIMGTRQQVPEPPPFPVFSTDTPSFMDTWPNPPSPCESLMGTQSLLPDPGLPVSHGPSSPQESLMGTQHLLPDPGTPDTVTQNLRAGDVDDAGLVIPMPPKRKKLRDPKWRTLRELDDSGPRALLACFPEDYKAKVSPTQHKGDRVWKLELFDKETGNWEVYDYFQMAWNRDDYVKKEVSKPEEADLPSASQPSSEGKRPLAPAQAPEAQAPKPEVTEIKRCKAALASGYRCPAKFFDNRDFCLKCTKDKAFYFPSFSEGRGISEYKNEDGPVKSARTLWYDDVPDVDHVDFSSRKTISAALPEKYEAWWKDGLKAEDGRTSCLMTKNHLGEFEVYERFRFTVLAELRDCRIDPTTDRALTQSIPGSFQPWVKRNTQAKDGKTRILMVKNYDGTDIEHSAFFPEETYQQKVKPAKEEKSTPKIKPIPEGVSQRASAKKPIFCSHAAVFDLPKEWDQEPHPPAVMQDRYMPRDYLQKDQDDLLQKAWSALAQQSDYTPPVPDVFQKPPNPDVMDVGLNNNHMNTVHYFKALVEGHLLGFWFHDEWWFLGYDPIPGLNRVYVRSGLKIPEKMTQEEGDRLRRMVRKNPFAPDFQLSFLPWHCDKRYKRTGVYEAGYPEGRQPPKAAEELTNEEASYPLGRNSFPYTLGPPQDYIKEELNQEAWARWKAKQEEEETKKEKALNKWEMSQSTPKKSRPGSSQDRFPDNFPPVDPRCQKDWNLQMQVRAMNLAATTVQRTIHEIQTKAPKLAAFGHGPRVARQFSDFLNLITHETGEDTNMVPKPQQYQCNQQ